MPLYTRLMNYGVAQPTPAHALTPEAEEARQAMRSYGYTKTVERTMKSLVTKHGHRRIVVHEGAPPANYQRVKRLAEAHGWTVREYRSPTGHALQGRRGDLGFRAEWHWGKTGGATWHEREMRWTLVADNRPVRMDKKAHVALKGARSAGMGTARLKLLATPQGLPLNVTELERRLNERALIYKKGKWS